MAQIDNPWIVRLSCGLATAWRNETTHRFHRFACLPKLAIVGVAGRIEYHARMEHK